LQKESQESQESQKEIESQNCKNILFSLFTNFSQSKKLQKYSHHQKYSHQKKTSSSKKIFILSLSQKNFQNFQQFFSPRQTFLTFNDKKHKNIQNSKIQNKFQKYIRLFFSTLLLFSTLFITLNKLFFITLFSRHLFSTFFL
jgi:hypothetical protein